MNTLFDFKPPRIEFAKRQAKRLKKIISVPILHSQALEATVRVYGYSGWHGFISSEYMEKLLHSLLDSQLDDDKLAIRRAIQVDRLRDYLALDLEVARATVDVWKPTALGASRATPVIVEPCDYDLLTEEGQIKPRNYAEPDQHPTVVQVQYKRNRLKSI